MESTPGLHVNKMTIIALKINVATKSVSLESICLFVPLRMIFLC